MIKCLGSEIRNEHLMPNDPKTIFISYVIPAIQSELHRYEGSIIADQDAVQYGGGYQQLRSGATIHLITPEHKGDVWSCKKILI